MSAYGDEGSATPTSASFMAFRSTEPVIQAAALKKHFTFGGGIIATLLGKPARILKAVDGVDIAIHEGEVFGLVGESGSGKSTLGMTLVRLYEATDGRIKFQGEDITELKGSALKQYRRSVQIIFQDPYASLNPRLTVAQIVEEPLRVHGMRDRRQRADMVVEALKRVRVPAEAYLQRYPYELSGGQRQRIAIARAIALKPKFIVADEPVSMLDVSIQAGVLELLEELARDLGLAILYVSHDIATVKYITDRMAVMYRGDFVEVGDTNAVTGRPVHPYTRRLMAAVPSVDPRVKRERVDLSIERVGRSWGDIAAADGWEPCDEPERHWIEVASDHFVNCPFH